MPSTILIVDDDSGNREAIESILTYDGYTLVMAENGRDAMNCLPAKQPDLILLDVMMPEMDGYEFCRRVRQMTAFAEIPIVMMTALDDRDSMLRGLESGADDFLRKPYDRYELRARVQSIIRLNRYRSLVNERARLAQAYSDLEIAYDATLRGWTMALDLRDNETEGHSERVTEITVKLAQACGFKGEELIHIRRGAMLHDIGKIGVPDAILRKPGKLDPAEWEVMKKHPIFAVNMLESIPYLHPALDIPYCHHEKWDGSGYPRGLRGEQIPLAARIFALVDVWDALTSDRPYRSAWSQQDTLLYIKEQKGTLFDPHLVDLFVDFIICQEVVANAER